MTGITDMDRKFHPISLAVCKNEKGEDFQFIFESLKAGVDDELKLDYQPNTLVSAHAISNGFKLIFGSNSNIIMCWAHEL